MMKAAVDIRCENGIWASHAITTTAWNSRIKKLAIHFHAPQAADFYVDVLTPKDPATFAD